MTSAHLTSLELVLFQFSLGLLCVVDD